MADDVKLDRLIVGRGGQEPAVGTPGDSAHGRCMTAEEWARLSVNIPETDVVFVETCGGQQLSVGASRHQLDRSSSTTPAIASLPSWKRRNSDRSTLAVPSNSKKISDVLRRPRVVR